MLSPAAEYLLGKHYNCIQQVYRELDEGYTAPAPDADDPLCCHPECLRAPDDDDEGNMVMCSGLHEKEQWFHNACMEYDPEEEVDTEAPWFCPDCLIAKRFWDNYAHRTQKQAAIKTVPGAPSSQHCASVTVSAAGSGSGSSRSSGGRERPPAGSSSTGSTGSEPAPSNKRKRQADTSGGTSSSSSSNPRPTKSRKTFLPQPIHPLGYATKRPPALTLDADDFGSASEAGSDAEADEDESSSDWEEPSAKQIRRAGHKTLPKVAATAAAAVAPPTPASMASVSTPASTDAGAARVKPQQAWTRDQEDIVSAAIVELYTQRQSEGKSLGEEEKFRYAARKLEEAGYSRSTTSIKNKWNRELRARWGGDERKPKKDGTQRQQVTGARRR